MLGAGCVLLVHVLGWVVGWVGWQICWVVGGWVDGLADLLGVDGLVACDKVRSNNFYGCPMGVTVYLA